MSKVVCVLGVIMGAVVSASPSNWLERKADAQLLGPTKTHTNIPSEGSTSQGCETVPHLAWGPECVVPLTTYRVDVGPRNTTTDEQ